MKKLILMVLVVAAMTGCAMSSYDPSAPELPEGAVAAAKADGAFGAQTIRLNELARGDAGGSAFSLFAIQLDETDQVRVSVMRTGGDLNPAAYLYRGTEDYIRPSSYETEDGRVALDYVLERGGEHHIVVKAYHGEGSGSFEVLVECIGGACAGVSADPLQRQSDCIEAAAQCAIQDLPRWDGRVGATRARSIFEGCLADEADATCAAACEGDGEAVCDVIVAALPDLADQSEACHGVLNTCLSACAEMGGYYDAYELGDTAASACWTGYNGNCQELIAGHAACGGADYAAGTRAECEAMCSATEGAWDEGPWDGCMDACNDLGREHDDFIRALADEVGEYPPNGESFGALDPVAYDALPELVREEVTVVIRRFDYEAMRAERTDRAFVSEEVYTITRDGVVVGYFVGVEYHIDDPLFDGAGANLYLNALGDLVLRTEWTG